MTAGCATPVVCRRAAPGWGVRVDEEPCDGLHA